MHMATLTKTERVNSSKTLVCLLQALSGRTTTIELRNELVIHGVVSMVDPHMNTTVTKATLCKLNNDRESFEQLFIHGNQIRYVHIPEDWDVMKVLDKQVHTLLGNPAGGKSLWKRKRISRARLNRQMEEKAAARAYKLGKGRTLPPVTQS